MPCSRELWRINTIHYSGTLCVHTSSLVLRSSLLIRHSNHICCQLEVGCTLECDARNGQPQILASLKLITTQRWCSPSMRSRCSVCHANELLHTMSMMGHSALPAAGKIRPDHVQLDHLSMMLHMATQMQACLIGCWVPGSSSVAKHALTQVHSAHILSIAERRHYAWAKLLCTSPCQRYHK
jgi:hypothetical protein